MISQFGYDMQRAELFGKKSSFAISWVVSGEIAAEPLEQSWR